jgi:2-hydroxychromene-2-carboxylate isomerase
MPIANAIRSVFMRRIADPRRRERRRAAAEAARRKASRPHTVHYFHQPDDPYSHMAAQVLRRFLKRYDVQLLPRIVAEPTPIAIHQQTLWEAWARRECAAMAPYYGLQYEDAGKQPDPVLTGLARRILLHAEASAEFPEIAVAVGHALMAHDLATLRELARTFGVETEDGALPRLQQNFEERHRLGHYLGAMFHYEGEWYWGIDRLHYLEERLEELGARRADAPSGPSAVPQRRAPSSLDTTLRVTGDDRNQRVRLEFFCSLRSPYTHLSYDRIADLSRRYPVDLVVRPVLPMMMRGVKADRRKGVYILRDTMREAERLGVPFGDIWDPFGEPVRRAYSLFPWARDQGKGLEYLHAYSLAVWSERVNAWSESGLQKIVERAGLSWNEARPHLDQRAWEPEMERNVADMLAAGAWGVPTLRLPAQSGFPEFTVWGQDRIWLVEEEIARRLGA